MQNMQCLIGTKGECFHADGCYLVFLILGKKAGFQFSMSPHKVPILNCSGVNVSQYNIGICFLNSAC